MAFTCLLDGNCLECFSASCPHYERKKSERQMTHSDKAREIVEKDWEWWDSASRSILDDELVRVITAALREAENAAYKKAAQVAETIPYVPYKGDIHNLTGTEWTRFTSEAIAAAIRALKAESK